MAQLLIEGGTRLVGRVPISGSKNAVLPILAACLLTEEEVRLKNVPRIEDVSTMIRLLEGMGVQIRWLDPQQLQINAERLARSEVLAAMASRMRASFLLMGPLLARRGEARVAKPGGDDIGMRRVEQHLVGLRLMGASVELEGSEYVARADRLKGATIHLDMPTVTGTENLMMAAATADGITTIHNAAREPHVVDLAMFLGKMGARIHGIGTDVLVIEGVPELSGATHRVIPDNIEAGTYAFAIAATGGQGVLEDVETADLRAMMLKLRAAGVEVEDRTHSLWVQGNGDLQPVDVTTWPHPGFPTDLQAPFVSLMTQAHGRCHISEAVFENRFQHVTELRKLGADIYVEGRSAIVSGPSALHGGSVTVPDIRSGAALVVAALCARGTTVLDNIYHLDRGYQDIVRKLEALGAHITRIDGEAADQDLSRVVGIEAAVLSKKIGIDLGTSTVLIYVKGEGVIVNEPAVMATDEKGARVLAVGRAASEMVGRGRKARAVRLVRDGNGVDYDVAGAMLQHLIGRIVGRQRLFRPDVMLSVAAMVTGVERRAVLAATIQAGAKTAYLIDKPMAAAIGARVPVSTTEGIAVVNLGAGSTELAAIALGEILAMESLPIGGEAFDRAIDAAILTQHGLRLMPGEAERLKMELGSASAPAVEAALEVGAVDEAGRRAALRVSGSEVQGAIQVPLEAIAAGLQRVMTQLSEARRASVVRNGVVLTGGGAQLRGIAEFLGLRSGLPTRVAVDPQSCVAIGTGMALDNMQVIRRGQHYIT